MKKLLLVTTIALSLGLASTPAAFAKPNEEQKAQETKNDLVGFGSGAITGGAVGGPIGAVVGGIIGLLIAEDVNNKNEIEQMDIELAQANTALEKQYTDFIALQSHIEELERQKIIRVAAFESQANEEWLTELTNFETNLQFKTASFLVEDNYTSQLNSLAEVLNNYPTLAVELTGYADHRGDSQYNKTLSEQRAEAVKRFLLEREVSATQIKVSGAGEYLTKTDASNSVEDLFFSRKVNVNIIKAKQQMTASSSLN
ncbi:sortase-associated OmpA-like protein PdsO [Glaciecola petra]|uniref:Sortase-associated OmpA-like protein PdsO n=1 Tax=Glaciecola petra TaxID=3075602 RepID=A0ABU2ZVC2_9ALTE|nr:sortase-associated OmpA-like protein PdsO [Aestuariibacter sp. P117]MDT0596595.1 sortase-associated OmpA-like protein PdsO [Aestuariibacter sp. P117]